MLRRTSKKSGFRRAAFALALLVFSLFSAGTAQAATLSISPATAKVSLGNIISMQIVVSTAGTAVNTAAATVQFPTDLLEVMSVSKSSSVFSLWVQDPTFSNVDGTITFTGGVPSPGFTGQGGQVISIVFKAKKAGTASVVFSDASVLQNDGLGTDVLTASQSATIQIASAAQNEVPTVTTVSNSLPSLPIVTSSTHPQQNTWYSGTSASFSWSVPSDVTSIQTLLSKSAATVPTVTYDSSVSERTVNNLGDGVLYFNIRYINSVGTGPTAHYKVQIDSTPPEKFVPIVATQGVHNILTLNAADAMSGIDSYSIKIDDQAPIRVPQASLVADQYVMPTQNQGEHSLTVLAYDKAGNSTEADASFTSLAIVPPTIAIHSVSPATQAASVIASVEVNRGDLVMITGQSQYPNTPIDIFVQLEGGDIKKYTTTTGADGAYSLLSDPLNVAGKVTAWSQLVFSDTVQSPLSDQADVHVNDSPIVQAGKSVIYGLSYIIPAVILLLVLLLALYAGWHKFFGLKRRIQKETQGTIEDIHHALVIFKDELESQLGKLEKIKEDRDLNKKEEKIFKGLQANIDSIDEFIEKKINKIK